MLAPARHGPSNLRERSRDLALLAAVYPPAPWAQLRMLLLVLFWAFGAIPVAGAQQRVLVVDIDDVGRDVWAAAHTPNLDRLAQVGRSYPNFYTAPVCSPTRARMQLGALLSDPEVLVGGIITQDMPFDLPLGPFVPLPRAAVDAGLSTAKVGKWHLCQRTRTDHPNLVGWQSYQGVIPNLSNLPDGTPQNYFHYLEVHDGLETWVPAQYLTQRETDLTIARLEAHVDLVSLSYHAVHKPFHVPPPGTYPGSFPTNAWEKSLAAMSALDRELGRLLVAAARHGYVVLLFSDNGTSAELGGGKGTLLESGIRTFLLAWGPGVVPGEDPSLVGAEDLYATVLDLLGVPRGPLHGPHSISFAPTLSGSSPGVREWVVSQRFPPVGSDPHLDPGNWWRAARTGPYKLLKVPDRPEPLFFDLLADPEETTDLLPASLTPEQWTAYDRLREVLSRL